MGKVSHGVDWRELTQVKHGSDSCFDDGGRVNAKNGINCANTSSSVRIREANTVQYRKLEGTMPRLTAPRRWRKLWRCGVTREIQIERSNGWQFWPIMPPQIKKHEKNNADET
jgi:hypothetical protein